MEYPHPLQEIFLIHSHQLLPIVKVLWLSTKCHHIFNKYLLYKKPAHSLFNTQFWAFRKICMSSWNLLCNLFILSLEPFNTNFSKELFRNKTKRCMGFASQLLDSLLIALKQTGFLFFFFLTHTYPTGSKQNLISKTFHGKQSLRGVNVQKVWFHKKTLNSQDLLPTIPNSPIANNFQLLFMYSFQKEHYL